jgi:hypothetical protein
MSFILVPSQGDDLQINGWNWRPTILLLHERGIIDDEQHQRMGAQAAGGYASTELAARIASCLELELARMKPGDRLRADLRITSAPKSGSLDAPVDDLYSATYEWLVKFRDFCQTCGGFNVL